jgi:hypothetical protein
MMKRESFTYTIAGILAGVMTLLHGVVAAQEVPKLKQKMPYSLARKILIKAGWQPIKIPTPQRSAQLFGATEYIVKQLGYNEVVDCSGTGMGYCRFEFKAADGRKLVVSTVNNQKGQQPILYRNWIEKNP